MKIKSLLLVGLLLCFTNVYPQLLDSLSLSEEPIYSSLEEALLNPDKVYRLTLRRKKLKEIPPEIFYLTNLQELNLSKNKITQIPTSINKLCKLQRLDLSQNKLITLAPELYDLLELQYLILNRNFIENLGTQIGNLTNLRYLDLWSNEIYRFPDEIMKLQNTLKVVDLRTIRIENHWQERIMNQLPNTKVLFTGGCNCN